MKKIYEILESPLEEISKDNLVYLLNVTGFEQDEMFEYANEKKKAFFGNKVFLRGVIEMSNICENNCKYCSMNKKNKSLKRYFIPVDEIIETVFKSYESGIRTFHLSSGENNCYSVDDLVKIIRYITDLKCKVILVIGRKSNEELAKLKAAGVGTFISKFETSNSWLYSEYNDKNGCLDFRLEFLNKLRVLGYKVGSGNIIGLPFQNDYSIIDDLMLLHKLSPEQASTSRFISNVYSQYSNYECGDVDKVRNFNSMMRIFLDGNTIIPSNSSFGNIDDKFNALLQGANLVSLNLTPDKYYKNYVIYNDDTRYKTELSDYESMLRSKNLELETCF